MRLAAGATALASALGAPSKPAGAAPVSASQTSQAAAPDPSEAAQRFAEFAQKSQRIAQAFWERQVEAAGDDTFTIMDPQAIGRAFFEFGSRLMADPARLAEAQMQLWQANLALWQHTVQRMLGEESEPLIEPDKGDRRFKDVAWNEDLVFDYIKQSYLLSARWLRGLVKDVEGLERRDREKVEFYTRQFVSAASPSNFVLTNPAVLRKAKETGGQNLLDGLQHLLDDLERGKGRLEISMSDYSAFEVGKNVATSPGKVVFQNELMQLIQYAPSTEQVYRRPFLIVPPWINKFYILDLQPRNSFIKWTVDQGHTVFVISWVNPRRDLAHKDFADYMLEGPLAALEAIEQATGEREINVLGFCIGGILIASTLAYLAARGDDRLKSATFFASLFDFNNVGEVSVFIDDEQIEHMEQHIRERGFLEGHYMADMFSMMRENDLIWSFVVNNYLLGREPPPFDLLYWNSDATRLPAAMLLFYLRKVYKENRLMQPGGLTLDGTPIDLAKVKTPVYIFATKEDHIAPWPSCYPGTQAFAGPRRFVLGASGHIAGVINPPVANKYGYWTNPRLPKDPQKWFEGAAWHEGSWWPDWAEWLARKGGPKAPARQPGEGKLTPLEDAPGSYVRARASE
jgi:polyhydroxyalkanoate synthase subunit PhaC